MPASDRSLGSDCRDGIDAHRAARGNDAGDEGNGDQESRRPGERGGVRRRHAVEESRERSRRCETADQADDGPNADECHAVTDDQQEHLARRRAKRQTNAHLARAARNRERQHAIDTDRGEQSARPPNPASSHAPMRAA